MPISSFVVFDFSNCSAFALSQSVCTAFGLNFAALQPKPQCSYNPGLSSKKSASKERLHKMEESVVASQRSLICLTCFAHFYFCSGSLETEGASHLFSLYIIIIAPSCHTSLNYSNRSIRSSLVRYLFNSALTHSHSHLYVICTRSKSTSQNRMQ